MKCLTLLTPPNLFLAIVTSCVLPKATMNDEKETNQQMSNEFAEAICSDRTINETK